MWGHATEPEPATPTATAMDIAAKTSMLRQGCLLRLPKVIALENGLLTLHSASNEFQLLRMTSAPTRPLQLLAAVVFPCLQATPDVFQRVS